MVSDMTDLSILNYEWPCPSCTYSNKPGSFKCHVCGTPKGTATRQTKYHPSTLEKQYIAETMSQQLLRFQFQSSRSAKSGQVSSSSPSNGDTGNSTTNSSTIGSIHGSSTSSSVPSLIIHKAQVSNTNSVTGKRRARTKVTQDLSAKLCRKEEFPWPKLKNIDRSNKRSCQVTVDNVTVTITEYDFLYSDSD